MNTMWNEISAWHSARDAADRAMAHAAATIERRVKQDIVIAELLRTRGPVLHGKHVYSLRDGDIQCEPCTDSMLIELEKEK